VSVFGFIPLETLYERASTPRSLPFLNADHFNNYSLLNPLKP